MKTKILVVDDETDLELLIRQKFRRQIREGVYEFVFAVNGREALAQLAEHPDTDVVLSDINMPVMDGLTLLGHLHQEFPIQRTVMVSAYGDMANIRAAMNKGAFDFVCKPVDFADLELTIEKTGEQVRQVRQSVQALSENDIMRLYVNENALQFMAGRTTEGQLLASETVEATVAFLDICGFTGISEQLPADTVVALLNAYLDEMCHAVLAQGGIIDKFIGDAVMAVFRGPDHAIRATRAALDARDRLRTQPVLPAVLPERPLIAVGLNTGEMVAGNIGSASLRRLDFTVVGDAVNLSQRIQSMAQPGQVLISHSTRQHLGAAFTCEALGARSYKNKAVPVETYEVTGEV